MVEMVEMALTQVKCCPAIGILLICKRERERELRLVEEEEDEGCPEFLWKDRGAYYADGEPIVLGLDEPVEFMVLPLEN